MILLPPKIITPEPYFEQRYPIFQSGASIENLTCTIDFSISPDYLIKVFHVGKDRTFMGEIFKISNYSIILYENHILSGSKSCAEANEEEKIPPRGCGHQ